MDGENDFIDTKSNGTSLDDSIIFVDEYIDLEAPNRGDVFRVKMELSSNDIEHKETNAVKATDDAINVKTEQSTPVQFDSDDVDIKPNTLQSGISMPTAIKEEAIGGDKESSIDKSKFIHT